MIKQVQLGKKAVSVVAALLLGTASFGAMSANDAAADGSSNAKSWYETMTSPGGTKQPPP